MKGHCPKCGAGINADIKGEYSVKWEDEQYGIDGEDQYRILQCRGCERVYFQTVSFFSENDPPHVPDIDHWPTPLLRREPRWVSDARSIDLTLHSLLTETYSAYNHRLRSLAAVGMRAVFDRSAEMLGVDPSLTFAEKMDELVKTGRAGANERGALEALTEAGNAAIHRGWHPSEGELKTMIEIMETFVNRNLFIIEAADKLKGNVPLKPPRRKKAKATIKEP